VAVTGSSVSHSGLRADTPVVRADAVCEAAAPHAVIELDRFCTSCAYNLRTMPVERDPGTGIPVVRCPECGTFQPANDATTAVRPWLQRLISLALAAWMLLLTAAFVWLVVAAVAVTYGTLDELTIRAGTQIQVIGNTTIRTVRGSGPLEVWTDMPHKHLFVGAMLAVSTVIAFVVGGLAVVAFPHWRRGVCRAVALAVPMLVASIATLAWYSDAPQLLRWSLSYTAAHGVAQMLGGLLGVTFGRSLARGVVRVFLPPRTRTHLSYLWLVDGKALPAV